MEKYIYDRENGMWYELRGDYFFSILGDGLMDEKANKWMEILVEVIVYN